MKTKMINLNMTFYKLPIIMYLVTVMKKIRGLECDDFPQSSSVPNSRFLHEMLHASIAP